MPIAPDVFNVPLPEIRSLLPVPSSDMIQVPRLVDIFNVFVPIITTDKFID